MDSSKNDESIITTDGITDWLVLHRHLLCCFCSTDTPERDKCLLIVIVNCQNQVSVMVPTIHGAISAQSLADIAILRKKSR